MSDSKWKKLINSIAEGCTDGCSIRYKLIHGNNSKSALFDDADDQFFIEPILYKEIEWVEFPCKYEDWINPNNHAAGLTTKLQDLERIRKVIESLGLFHVEDSGCSIRVYGYL